MKKKFSCANKTNMVWRLTFWKQLNVLGGFFTLWVFQVNSWVTISEITLQTMFDVVVRLTIVTALTLVKGFITSTGLQLLERQLSWVITFITEEIYLFNAIIPQLDHMDIDGASLWSSEWMMEVVPSPLICL